MDPFAIIKNSDFFNTLTDDEIKYIVKSSATKGIKKGSIIHNSNEVCKNITVVLDGKIYSSNYSLTGKEQIVCSFDTGKVFGYPVVFGDLTYPENITAETNCRLLYISREVLIELFKNKAFLMQFINMLAQKVKYFSNLVEILSYTSVRERVGKYLLNLTKASDSTNITLSKNKTRLAKELGTDRVVVSRTFKALEDEGIIKRSGDKKITILDIDALRLFS